MSGARAPEIGNTGKWIRDRVSIEMLVDTSATVKLSTMRQVITKRKIESKSKVPHFYLTMDCEIDELLRVRKSLNDAQSDVRVSVNDFVIRACGMGLMKVPAANVAYKNENEMLQFQTADISVAVALEGGLITPIVRAVENKVLSRSLQK